MSRLMMNRLGVLGAGPRPMDRLLETLLSPENSMLGALLPEFRQAAYPEVNVWEDEGNVYVEAEIPGIGMDEIEITMLGGDLTITGERRAVQAPQGAVFHRRERPEGRFSRTISVGVPVDADKVSASLENGVLMVTLPKAEEAKPRKIEVKAKS